jgi:hypothetical protein
VESRELIGEFRRQLADLESQGVAEVQVTALQQYLNALDKQTTLSKEHLDRELAKTLATGDAKAAFDLEMFKSVLEAGKSALQSLIVINGGAVIALLGVMSTLIGKQGGDVLARYLALPLLQFGLGVLFGTLGFALRYFSQACYANDFSGDKSALDKWGDRLRIAAISAGFCGFVAFALGLVNSYLGVTWAFAP